MACASQAFADAKRIAGQARRLHKMKLIEVKQNLCRMGQPHDES